MGTAIDARATGNETASQATHTPARANGDARSPPTMSEGGTPLPPSTRPAISTRPAYSSQAERQVAPTSPGVPKSHVDQTLTVPFNDPAAAETAFSAHGGQIACMILEPVPGNMGLVTPAPGYLEELRRLTVAWMRRSISECLARLASMWS